MGKQRSLLWDAGAQGGKPGERCYSFVTLPSYHVVGDVAAKLSRSFLEAERAGRLFLGTVHYRDRDGLLLHAARSSRTHLGVMTHYDQDSEFICDRYPPFSASAPSSMASSFPGIASEPSSGESEIFFPPPGADAHCTANCSSFDTDSNPSFSFARRR